MSEDHIEREMPPLEIPLACPFCGETDFDAVGLKIHLTTGYCEPFVKLSVSLPRTRLKP